MNQVTARIHSCYTVQFGTVTLCLQAYEVKGQTVLTERVTADNLPAVTASYPKGTRLTLRGGISALEDAAAVTAVLAQYLQEGTVQDITVGTLQFPAARLVGYAVSEADGDAQVQLQFYCAAVPVQEAGEGA